MEAASQRDENIYKIKGLGSKMVNKIYYEIDKALTKPSLLVSLPKIMSGSLIFDKGMGTRKLKTLVTHIPDILTKYKPSYKINKIIIIRNNRFNWTCIY